MIRHGRLSRRLALFISLGFAVIWAIAVLHHGPVAVSAAPRFQAPERGQDEAFGPYVTRAINDLLAAVGEL